MQNIFLNPAKSSNISSLIIVSKKPFYFLLFIQLLIGPLVGFSSSESASSDKMTTIATSLAAIFVWSFEFF